jgi:hypothetical protein
MTEQTSRARRSGPTPCLRSPQEVRAWPRAPSFGCASSRPPVEDAAGRSAPLKSPDANQGTCIWCRVVAVSAPGSSVQCEHEKAKLFLRSTGKIDDRAPVAQWIERRPPEPKVAGSNPVGRASTNVPFLGKWPCPGYALPREATQPRPGQATSPTTARSAKQFAIRGRVGPERAPIVRAQCRRRAKAGTTHDLLERGRCLLVAICAGERR